MVKAFEARIAEKHEVAEKTLEVVFDLSPQALVFKAGQYMTVTIDGLSHDFSIASSPDHPGRLALATRLSPSSFKQALLSAPIGAAVTIEAPKGVFTLPEPCEKPIALIAGGIGITPFMSMVRYAARHPSSCQVSLFAYDREEKSAAYLHELEALAEQKVFMLQAAYGPFDGESFEKRLGSPLAGTLFYIAGPPEMVKEVRAFLLTRGVQDRMIHAEEFTGYAKHV